jgi:hypothetical protein
MENEVAGGAIAVMISVLVILIASKKRKADD